MAVNIIYYVDLLSIDLYNLFVPFSLTGWIINTSSPYLELSSTCSRYAIHMYNGEVLLNRNFFKIIIIKSFKHILIQT